MPVSLIVCLKLLKQVNQHSGCSRVVLIEILLVKNKNCQKKVERKKNNPRMMRLCLILLSGGGSAVSSPAEECRIRGYPYLPHYG